MPEDLSDDDKARLRAIYEDLGYKVPEAITIQGVRDLLAGELGAEESVFTVDTIEAIADAILEGMPDEDDNEEGEDDGEEEADA